MEQRRSIFVFGSNRLGVHGKGAALYAYQHYGAIRGQGEGLQGNSYAIPTKSGPYESLSLTDIKEHVDEFVAFAKVHPELQFHVTPIGTGYAGHKVQGIAPLFKQALNITNIQLPFAFLDYLNMEESDCRPQAAKVVDQ